MPFETPVLLLIWRRPKTLRRLIDALRQVSPTNIYVFCDGPNPCRPEEVDKVAASRALIDQLIDWPCKIERLYSESNLGCRVGVSTSITWFFEQVEAGIILEDDCVPHPDFFYYCQLLLKRYRYDMRVWSICGSNFQLGHKRGSASYYFSIHGDSWGWATWRRAWIHYESVQHKWVDFRDSRRLEDVFPIRFERYYWTQILDRLFLEGKPSSWAYQWWCAGWMNNALHVWPNVNPVSNIGFDKDGTHTLSQSSFSSMELYPLTAIKHPDFIVPSRDADSFAFFHRRNGIRFILLYFLGPVYYPVVTVLKAVIRVYYAVRS